MVLVFFNTLGLRKESFVPLHENEIRIYVCGPTVYDFIHIGNARAFIAADVIRRYFEYKGFRVKLVSNITDVDDKMIKRSEETDLSLQQLGEVYSDAYFEDIAKLGVKKPDISPRATQHISEIIESVQSLIEKGCAYEVDGDVYFDISRFQTYGKLSGNKAEALESSARIEINPRKKNAADFALWKKQKGREPGWHSPWGIGRPGWHIECSTMSMKYLGATFDIHMGGKDLIFPHHENEIAQAESTTCQAFARYWLHNEWLTVDGEKMSKSLGNFITVRDALKMCEPQVLRFFLLSAHYRSPIDFSKENLKLAESNLKRLANAQERLNAIAESAKPVLGEEKLLTEVGNAKEKFESAMDDDLNTPLAIAAIFDLVKAVNNFVDGNNQITASCRGEVVETMTQLLGVLGIVIKAEIQVDQNDTLRKLVDLIIDQRNEMRKRMDWKTSDQIRNKLQKIGFIIEDTKEGTRWKAQKQT